MNQLEFQLERLPAQEQDMYVTKRLIHLLNKHLPLAAQFAEEVLGISPTDDCALMPQATYQHPQTGAPVFADMAFYNSHFTCLVQVRLQSEAGAAQEKHEAYAAILDEEARKGKAVYARQLVPEMLANTAESAPEGRIGWPQVYIFLRTQLAGDAEAHEFIEMLEHQHLSAATFNGNDLHILTKNVNLFHRLSHLMEPTRQRFGFAAQDLRDLHDYRHHKRLVYLQEIFTDEGHSDYGFGLDFSSQPALYVWLWLDEHHERYADFCQLIQELPAYDFTSHCVDTHKDAHYIRFLLPIEENQPDLQDLANRWYADKLEAVMHLIQIMEARYTA